MAINFPNSPSIGQTHTHNNRTWEYDGTSWFLLSTPEIDPVFSASDASNVTSQKISNWDDAYTNVNNILSGSSADYDTFVEILQYIQNADTALNTDIIDNYNTLNTRIDNLEVKDSAGDATLEQSINDLELHSEPRVLTIISDGQSQTQVQNYNIIYGNGSADISYNLDSRGNWPSYYKVIFKNISSTYNFTLKPFNDNVNPAETVDGSTNDIVISPNRSLAIIKDGNNLRILHDDRHVTPSSITNGASSIIFDSNDLVDIDTAIKIHGVQELFSSDSGNIDSGDVVNFDAENSYIHRLSGTISGNFTANITNLNLLDNYATNVSIIIEQGSSPYIIDTLQLATTPQTIEWAGGTLPTGNANKTEILSFTILNLGASTYKVLGQLTTFG
tara:strand:- start:9509 stop:10675 length:1167 start_codon:yes stop_codon:yes gene_type:complete